MRACARPEDLQLPRRTHVDHHAASAHGCSVNHPPRMTTCVAPATSRKRNPCSPNHSFNNSMSCDCAAWPLRSSSNSTTLASKDLNFEERLGLLIQHDGYRTCSPAGLRQRLRWAKFTQTAALEDLDLKLPVASIGQRSARSLTLAGSAERLNVIVTGPTGVGKSFLACAIGDAACRADHSVRCFRLPRLIDELTRHAVLQTKSTFLRQIAKADLLILDDLDSTPLPDQFRRDLLEIFDDRYDPALHADHKPATGRASGTPTSRIRPRRCDPRPTDR